MHAAANRATMAAVKLRIAAAAAIAVGSAIGIARSRRTRLRVVAADGSTVRPGRPRPPGRVAGQGPGRGGAQRRAGP